MSEWNYQRDALVDLGGTWVKVSAIEAIQPYAMSDPPGARIYITSESVIIRGLTVDQVLDRITKAMLR